MLRAIHVFPDFANVQLIQDLRVRYDPLASLIPPHMTLVFPFESDITTKCLTEHMTQSTMGLKPFRVVLTGVTGVDGAYLFLNVKLGNDQLIQLHDTLYTGILRPYLNRSRPYIPHVTVGRLRDKQQFATALIETGGLNDTFETIVCEIALESIDEYGKSTIEFKAPLVGGKCCCPSSCNSLESK